MKLFFYFLVMSVISISSLQAAEADELMQVHKVTTAEMNSISTPQAGSLVYNTDEKSAFFYTGTAWKKMRAKGDETVVNAGSNIAVAGDGTSANPYTVGVN
jgi:hypothetical protein